MYIQYIYIYIFKKGSFSIAMLVYHSVYTPENVCFFHLKKEIKRQPDRLPVPNLVYRLIWKFSGQ